LLAVSGLNSVQGVCYEQTAVAYLTIHLLSSACVHVLTLFQQLARPLVRFILHLVWYTIFGVKDAVPFCWRAPFYPCTHAGHDLYAAPAALHSRYLPAVRHLRARARAHAASSIRGYTPGHLNDRRHNGSRTLFLVG